MMNPMKNIFFQSLILILFHLAGSSLWATQPLDLETIFREYRFYPGTVSGYRSLANGKNYTVIEEGNRIVQYDYGTGSQSHVIFDGTDYDIKDLQNITEYAFSSDESRILLTTRKVALYRYSFYSYHYVYDRETDSVIAVNPEHRQRLASLSPDGKHVAYVLDNNMYLCDLQNGHTRQITYDGEINKIINGAPDWVYEEEFALEKAYSWSSDSKYIAYYRFDESEVPEYTIPMYAGLYPELNTYKYPKAGEKNSQVEICVYTLQGDSTRVLSTGNDPERYVPRIFWHPGYAKLGVCLLNRRQDHLNVLLYDIEHGDHDTIYTEVSNTYITETDDHSFTFLSGSDRFIAKTDRDGYMHLYLYDLKGELVSQITSGEWEVTNLLGIDENAGWIYYSSNEESPLEQHLYRTGFDGTGTQKLTTTPGSYHADFSSDFSFSLVRFSDANTPYRYSIHDGEGGLIREIENNERVVEEMQHYGFTEKQFFSFRNEDGVLLYGYMILPPAFRERKKYPVLVYTYGGPSVQLVKNEWSNRMAWFQYLGQQGYIVVCIDNRGSDGRGTDFKKIHYLQLGKFETADQIALARYLTGLRYVDSERIGIFGWSYGGYLSLLCMTKGNEYFKTGIAVAPVTNWRFYDTIYTERYMRKPSENASGYDDNSPINHISELKGNLLLIHGMGDDNVHLQNSAELIKELVSRDKVFDSEFYPNKNHGIYGGNTTYHLYHRMTEYILENL